MVSKPANAQLTGPHQLKVLTIDARKRQRSTREIIVTRHPASGAHRQQSPLEHHTRDWEIFTLQPRQHIGICAFWAQSRESDHPKNYIRSVAEKFTL